MGLDPQAVEDERNRGMMRNGLIYILIMGFLLAGKVEAAEPQAADQVKHQVMSFDLEGLADNGTKKWDVKGKSAEAISATEVKLDDIVASSYGRDAQATITADKGVYDKTKNNVRLEQNVKATIESAKDRGSDFMDFSGVLASGPKEKKDPAAKAKKTKTLIVCDGEVQFDYEKNQAYFDRNVVVTNEEGIINADRITINLDPATKTVKDIVCDGNVRIVRGENVTYSEKATYIEADKKVLLTGQPRVVIYQEGSLADNVFGKK